MMLRAIVVSTIVLGLAGLAAGLARRASASVRHAIWLVGLTTALGVAALSAFGPTFRVETTVVNRNGAVPFNPEFIQSLRSVAAEPRQVLAPAATTLAEPAPRIRLRPAMLLLVIYLLGVVAIIGRSVLGHVAAARLIRRSHPMRRVHRAHLGMSIDVRVSADIATPFTLGARHAVILLPVDAESWDDERLRIVLVHELAHVARLDYVAQLVATAACAVYWFNPITWLAAARLRAEAEHAADDRVLAAGVDGVTYASHLLELARPQGMARLSTAVAVGMARGNRLERRFTAMLDSTRSRGTVPLRLQAALGSAAMLVALPMTGLRMVPVPEKTVAAPKVASAVVAPAIKTTRPSAPRISNSATRRVPSSAATGVESDSTIDRTLAAAAGERITIDLRMGGSITVHAWDQAQVRMHAVLSGDQSRETRVAFERVGGGLSLRAYMDYYPRNSRNSNSFELWVPRKFNVSLSSAGGAISIDGVEGRFSGETGGGEITLENVKGEADLSTGGGEVHVTGSTLDGRVSTGGGEAIVTSTSGNVRVNSGSGPVIRTSESGVRSFGINGVGGSRVQSSMTTTTIGDNVISGAFSMSRAGGDIRIEDVPNGGSFNTGGGEIVIGSVGGAATFTTGGGDITLKRVSDDVTATTGAGEVQISVISGNGVARNVAVYSGSGKVVIDLPANLDARFDVETAYTDNHDRTNITSDFSLNVTETQEWDSRNGTPRRYVRGTGSVGSGRGLIKIRTVNGDVVIRRR